MLFLCVCVRRFVCVLEKTKAVLLLLNVFSHYHLFFIFFVKLSLLQERDTNFI